jgi:hypothetical protein
LIQNAPEKVPVHAHSPLTLQNSHHSNSSLRRNNSSILVITAPLNNANNEDGDQSQHHQHQQQQLRQQSQIIANIENNSINYELDDDGYSQISFKHHLRHDEGTSSRGSLHNQLDNTSISTTNTSATTRNLASGDNDSNVLRMIPGGLQEVQEAEDDEKRASRQERTSMFVENSDILNDDHYPKLYYRHSSLLLPTTAKNSRSIDGEAAAKEKQHEKRRYSDTKLLNSLHFENELLVKNPTAAATSHSQDDVLGSPKHHDDNFDALFDQLELNIQNILEIDEQRKKSSKDASEKKQKENLSEKRNIFQSLPNLSS